MSTYRVSHQPDAALGRRILGLTAVLLAVCLGLERFGVPFGGKHLNIVGPVGLVLAGYGIVTGILSFHRVRLFIFLGLVFWITLGIAWHAMEPTTFNGGAESSTSIEQFLLLTAFGTLTFSEAVSEDAFLRLVTLALMVIGVAGAIQFVAQFAGVRVFEFTGLLPSSILFEASYHVLIPLGVGDLYKSNGLFLIEPSAFSQLMALGLIIEVVAFRRARYLAIFIVGLLLSFSGTGWIVLASFLLAAVLAMGWRGILISLLVVVLLGAALGLAAYFAPNILAAVGSRTNEIQTPGTSGFIRFVTPFWLLSDAYTARPMSVLLGIGGGASESLTLPYAYAVNTPVKIAVEYGIPALIPYVLLFVIGRRTAQQAAVLVPAMVLFFLTGGYQQFPPMIFITFLLTSVANLTVTQQRHADAPVYETKFFRRMGASHA